MRAAFVVAPLIAMSLARASWRRASELYEPRSAIENDWSLLAMISRDKKRKEGNIKRHAVCACGCISLRVCVRQSVQIYGIERDKCPHITQNTAFLLTLTSTTARRNHGCVLAVARTSAS